MEDTEEEEEDSSRARNQRQHEQNANRFKEEKNNHPEDKQHRNEQDASNNVRQEDDIKKSPQEKVNDTEQQFKQQNENIPTTQHKKQEDEEDLQKSTKKRVNRIMLTLYLLAFLASFSYWVQSGVLPYLTRKIGMNTELFGLMESTYAFYQMITSPVYGRIGDLCGVRILYLLSEISASITFGSLAFAQTVPQLFLTRVPALFMHSVQCSYMIITDVSGKRERADLIGKLGVLHGIYFNL